MQIADDWKHSCADNITFCTESALFCLLMIAGTLSLGLLLASTSLSARLELFLKHISEVSAEDLDDFFHRCLLLI